MWISHLRCENSLIFCKSCGKSWSRRGTMLTWEKHWGMRMAFGSTGALVPKWRVREHAGRGQRPAPAGTASVCGQTQHTPQRSCQVTPQSPIKPTSKRSTGTLGSQILATVTLAGAVPCRPQAGSLQTYPASSKSRAQLPCTHKGHVT